MEGFDIFVYIFLGIAAASIAIGFFLRKRGYDRLVGRMFAGLFLLSISIIVISLLIGGWEGMGYGFMGMSIFLGTMIGAVVMTAIRPMKRG